MQRQKPHSDYASDYKFRRAASISDKRQHRLQRRSIDWKEQREGAIDKCRNIEEDLSPVQEGNTSQDKNYMYKEKTPSKPKDDAASKGQSRLEMLKKWKAEREKKRQEVKKGSVFRVSKAMEYGDQQLFQSSAKPRPIKVQPVPTFSKPVSAPTKATHNRATRQTAKVETKPSAHKAHKVGRTKPTVSSTTASSTVKPVQTHHKPAPTSQQSDRRPATTRLSARLASKSNIEPKVTRQMAKARGATTKFRLPQTKPHPPVEPQIIQDTVLNLTKVNTRRGGFGDSFAASDFTFTAPSNVSSFMFKPMSPASAASFLFPNQDSSQVSFMETKSRPCSTPKVVRDVSGSRKQTRACSVFVSSDDESPSKIIPESLSTQPRRSLRRSVANICDDIETSNIDKTIVNPEPMKDSPKPLTSTRQSRRLSRRSFVTTDSLEKVEVTAVEADTVVVAEDINNSNQATPSGKRRRSLRKSLLSVDESANTDSSDCASDEIVSNSQRSTPSRRHTRSLRKSIVAVSGLCSISEFGKANESDTVSSESLSDSQKPTPSKRPRRSSRRSVAAAESGSLVCATSDDSGSVFNESGDTNEKLSSDVADGNRTETGNEGTEKVSDSGIWEDKSTFTKTPATAPRNRRSFALPDTESLVLSGKRLPKRNNMPKSPEDWVDLLNGSPMVEMTRRTPKPKVMADTLNLNFDDIDLEQMEGVDEPSSTSIREPMVYDDAVPSTSTELEANGSFIEVTVTRSEVSIVPVPSVASPTLGSGPPRSSENVQVEEISSTRDGPLSNEEEEPVHDVTYFRHLLASETSRLAVLSDHWTAVNADTPHISEDMRGQLRTTVGQAQLLMNQRFCQFSGLVDDCEFGRGEKETTYTDLQGFWDMIFFQVEDVNTKFAELTKLQANNWVDDKPQPVVKKTKKKVAKTTKPVVKSKFASFRSHMKKQPADGATSDGTKQEDKVFEMPAFFKVTSPIRTPKPHCEGGTPKKSVPTATSSSTDEVTDPTPPVVINEPSSQEILMGRTPIRKSYAPAVPSPLLVDSTPQPRPTRLSTMKTSVPKRLLEPECAVSSAEVNPTVRESPDLQTDSSQKATPRRRSLRVRKSVNFADEPAAETPPNSPEVMNVTPEEFARFLQPITPRQNSADEHRDVGNDSFSKYLQPTGQLDDSIEKENSPEPKRRRHTPILKPTKSLEKRRSCSRNVHFFSSSGETSHAKLPITPYNRDLLVKPKRKSRRSHSASSPSVNDDVFDIENIDEDAAPSGNTPRYKSSRPSLLYTPPKRNSLKVVKDVPTATLISFTP